MNTSKKILEAYFLEQFKEADIEPDTKALNALLAHVQLSEGESNEENETRGTVYIKEDHHGELSAKHINWYNLVDINWYDLFGLGLDAAPIMVMPVNLTYQIAFACVKIIYDFYPKLTYEFKREDDAKILGAIALLSKEKFTLEEVKISLKKNFKEELADDYFARAIAFFRKKAILRYIGNDRYQLEEKMDYDRA